MRVSRRCRWSGVQGVFLEEGRIGIKAQTGAGRDADVGLPARERGVRRDPRHRAWARASWSTGQALDGRNAIAGEWGHNPLPWPRDDERPGALCYCGRRGCIETWVSGPGLRARPCRARRPRCADRADRRASRGRRCGGDGLVAALRGAPRALARARHQLLDPDVIVLGGGMSNVDRLYDAVPKLWGAWVFSDRVDTRLVRNVHGDSSGVRGAARLWPMSRCMAAVDQARREGGLEFGRSPPWGEAARSAGS